MKSVQKKSKPFTKQQFSKQQTFSPIFQQPHQITLSQQQMRRFSQVPLSQQFYISKPINRQSRMTCYKSQHPQRRKGSLTPNSKISETNITYEQLRFKQIQQILNNKNTTLQLQNEFLKQQIRKLYERQGKYCKSLTKYKQQVKFLGMENQIYQSKYLELKQSITQAIEKIIKADQQKNDQLKQICSWELVNKLREQLYQDDQYVNKSKQGQFQDEDQYMKQKKDKFPSNRQSDEEDRRVLNQLDNQDQTDKFFSQRECEFQQRKQADLQETRFKKQATRMVSEKSLPNQYQQTQVPYLHINKKSTTVNPRVITSKNMPPLYPSNVCTSPNQSSNPNNQNSECKTIDRIVNNNIKATQKDNLNSKFMMLQDTSQTNCHTFLNQQIQELTDQSQALMYQLRKTGNQDKEIKKKIIRISQKIRELKMDKTKSETGFTSLQNIVTKK